MHTSFKSMPYFTFSAGLSGGGGSGVAAEITCINLMCGGSMFLMAVCISSQMSRRAGAGSATAAARARASACRFSASDMSWAAPITLPANSSNRSSARRRRPSSSASIPNTRVTSRTSSVLRSARCAAIRSAITSKVVAKAGPDAAPMSASPGPPATAPAAAPAAAAAICFRPLTICPSVRLFTEPTVCTCPAVRPGFLHPLLRAAPGPCEAAPQRLLATIRDISAPGSYARSGWSEVSDETGFLLGMDVRQDGALLAVS